MEAKGSVLQSVPKFIRKRFGEDAVQRWIGALTPEAAELYSGSILSGSWYPITPYLSHPTARLCDLFYKGDPRGAWEAGMFASDDALRGIYRAFVMIGSPMFIIRKGSSILPTFYRPATVEVIEVLKNSVTVRFTQFPEPHPMLEARLGGWMEQGLIICGCKAAKVHQTLSMSKGNRTTEYDISWE